MRAAVQRVGPISCMPQDARRRFTRSMSDAGLAENLAEQPGRARYETVHGMFPLRMGTMCNE